MSKYKGGFLKAGEVFKFVHFCAPQNSQEKYSEVLNGVFKTTIAHKNHEGIARLANVSVGTVDRVIHNRGRVSEENIRRVKEIMEQVGYVAVHFTVHLNVFHYVPVIGFQSAVEVVQIMYSRNRTCSSIE